VTDATTTADLNGTTAEGPLLAFDNLTVTFTSDGATVYAIRGVTFSIAREEVVGLVGESGSGKSVTSLAAMGLLAKNATVGGSVKVLGREVVGLKEKDLSKIRGTDVAMIFQDPLTALNPVYTVGWQIIEALQAHRDFNDEQAKAEAIRLLTLAGIPRPEDRLSSYPHEFSGGMRQRVVIAIAMANQPQIILADEPTTALDVTVQAQVMRTLQLALEETKSSLLLITHDLGVIAGIADRVLVMYAGRIVESGTAEDIFYQPAMPYTHGLLGSIPSVDSDDGGKLAQVPGNPPVLTDAVVGCPFAPRCPMRQAVCLESEPSLQPVSDTHSSACHFASEVITLPIGQMFAVDDEVTP